MKKYNLIIAAYLTIIYSCDQKNKSGEGEIYSGNPVFPGWYADPEGIIFDNEYWIYPTYSDHFEISDRVIKDFRSGE